MSRRRYKSSFDIKLLIFLLVSISVLVYVYFTYKDIHKIDKFFDTDELTTSIINTKVYDITDSSESDSSTIDTIFMKGMEEADYKKILDKLPSYISNSNSFKTIDYNFQNKMHYDELEKIYNNMSSSNNVNVEIIGKSVDNRNIYGIEIGSGDKVLFIDANIHAAEVGTTLILTKFLSDLINDYNSNDKDVVSALNNVKIVAIPCLNPDGYEIYNYGIESINNKELWIYKNKKSINFDNIKSNANGVDLNRNFPTQNVGMYYVGKKLISNTVTEKTTKSGKYFNGYSAGSEPETKAAMYFMLKHYKNAYAYINLHSQGRVIYAGKPNLSDEFNNITTKFAKKVSKINGYTVHGLSSEEVGEGNDGSATDFMAELANGFIFSSKTGRLSSDKYIENSSILKYNYPVITMETLKVWSSDPKYFKTEYYDYKLKDLFYKLINNNF